MLSTESLSTSGIRMNRVSLTVQFDSEFLLFTTVSKETKCQRSLILAIIYLRIIYDKNLIISDFPLRYLQKNLTETNSYYCPYGKYSVKVLLVL